MFFSIYFVPKCIEKPIFQTIRCELARVIITLGFIFLVNADDDDDDDGDDDDDDGGDEMIMVNDHAEW